MTTIEDLKPGIKRRPIKNHTVLERSTNTLSQELFLDMFANHKHVSNILRVEAKRETISIQAELGNKTNSIIIKGFKPRTKRELIKETFFCKTQKHDPDHVFGVPITFKPC